MLTQEVAVCVAGVGQCASLKVRMRANPCVFTVNLSALGRESNSRHSFSLKCVCVRIVGPRAIDGRGLF